MSADRAATIAASHPAIERALAIIAEVHGSSTADAASNSLDHLLAGAVKSPAGKDAMWSSSRLGRTGFPVEFAFVTSSPGLRYTAEVESPERPLSGRFAQACEQICALSGNAMPDKVVRTAVELQRGAELKYGAWIGCRHDEEGSSYKIYIEVPAGRSWLTEGIPVAPKLHHRNLEMSMLGYQFDRMEAYYAVEGLSPGEVATAMAPIGMESRANEVLDLLAEARMRPIHREMPCSNFGFSYALTHSGFFVFTFYAFANSLFGGDGRIRAALLKLAERRDWALPLYERLSEPLAEARGRITHHGLFGIVVPAEGQLGISIGLAPPPL